MSEVVHPHPVAQRPAGDVAAEVVEEEVGATLEVER